MSIKKLKIECKKEGKTLVTTSRKEPSLILTNVKIEKLEELCSELFIVKKYFNHTFNNLSGMAFIFNFHEMVRDQYVKMGLPPAISGTKLQARQWKAILDDVFATITSRYELICDEIKMKLSKNSNFADDERHYLRTLLKFPFLVSSIGTGRKIDEGAISLRFNLNNKSKKKIYKWLRRQIRIGLSKKGKAKFKALKSFSCDSNMYSFFKGENNRSYIGVMGLEPRKRIIIPLTNNQLTKDDFLFGNIKVVVKSKHKVEIHRTLCKKIDKPIEEKKVDPRVNKIVGVDAGFTTAFSTSEGTEYGKGLGEILKSESNRRSEINKVRNHFYGVVKHYKIEIQNLKISDPARKAKLQEKINNIERNNLGSLKYKRKREKADAKIADFINTACNSMIKNERPSVLLHEDLSFISNKKILSKTVKRYFSGWLKGVVKRKVELSCQQNSVLCVKVNAAYSSQVCANCLSLKTKRDGEKLHCYNCNKDWNANILAGINLKSRFRDEGIHLYTPYLKVKEILIQRFNEKTVQTVEPRPKIGSVQSPLGANYLEIV